MLVNKLAAQVPVTLITRPNDDFNTGRLLDYLNGTVNILINMGPDKIVWLASYPKSGNTWMRAFLTALLKPDKEGLDINNLVPSTIASSRQLFDEMAGVSASDLLPEEIDRLRPAIYRQNAMESEELVYHKIHDAWIRLPGRRTPNPGRCYPRRDLHYPQSAGCGRILCPSPAYRH